MARSVLLLLACVAACSPHQAPDAPDQVGISKWADANELKGRWRILSVDGKPPASREEGDRAPVLSFGDQYFGGSAGCNSFGGLGLLADGRFAIHSWSSTLVGCHNEQGRQEEAISKLFFARPRVAFSGPDYLRIESSDHVVELERTGPIDTPPVPTEAPDLTDTSWRIVMINGEEASTTPTTRTLRFGKGSWQGLASCATLAGTWRREGDRIVVGEDIATTEQNCPARFAAIDSNFAALMRSNPRYLVGPNGEILLAGGGHALAGGRLD